MRATVPPRGAVREGRGGGRGRLGWRKCLAVGRFVSVLVGAGWLVGVGSAAAQLWDPALQVGALAAARVVLPDAVRARREGGEGRLRYGDGSDYGGDVLFSPAEAALEIDAAANRWLALFVHGQYQPEDPHGAGIVRGFLEVSPPPFAGTSFRVKGGAFFPGVSRENRDLAWSNSYTLTNSPAKTWIAEEVRPVGMTLSASRAGGEMSVTLEGGFFFANDGSGAALATGGWALNDVKTALTGEVRAYDPAGGPDPAVFEPFRELDDRAGFQLLAQFDLYRHGGLSVLYWDNQGDVGAGEPGEVVWETRFGAADLEIGLPWELTLLPSAMLGETRNRDLGTDFWTASVLLARDFGALRAALRYDHFEQKDNGDGAAPSLDEDGDALTTALAYSLGSHHRFAAELVYATARREGQTPSASDRKNETMLQIEYRLVY
jgi:hypothetical protein